MTLLWLIPGLLLPTVTGWLLIRILEGKTPVLFRLERWVLGFVLGLTLTMFVTFIVHISTNLALTKLGYLVPQLILMAAFGSIWWLKYRKFQTFKNNYSLLTTHYSLPKWARIAILILIIWTAVKVLSIGITFSLLTPPYLDDTVDNWNFRGKVFFVEHAIVLELPDENGEPELGGINSYPPTVSLTKAELATIAGKWSEPLVNSINLLWYFAVLVLLFFALKRHLNSLWALLGIYLLTSLPLYMMHGTNPYSDVFLSVHIFAAISMLYHAISSDDPKKRQSFLRISAFATALLPFTKNEAMMIHIPTILLVLAIALWMEKRKDGISNKTFVRSIMTYLIPLAIVAIPWIAFKWVNGLTFGNAQTISGMDIAWQSGVLKSIAINTFLEGNWLLLFPLLIFLLIAKKQIAFKTPLLILTGFFLIIYLGQLPLYMFTFLATEALYQTGYARGLIQLAPVIVMVTSVLLSHCFQTCNQQSVASGQKLEEKTDY